MLLLKILMRGDRIQLTGVLETSLRLLLFLSYFHFSISTSDDVSVAGSLLLVIFLSSEASTSNAAELNDSELARSANPSLEVGLSDSLGSGLAGKTLPLLLLPILAGAVSSLISWSSALNWLMSAVRLDRLLLLFADLCGVSLAVWPPLLGYMLP